MPYTTDCQTALESARRMAVEFDGAKVRPLHVLMGVASSRKGRWLDAVMSLGVELEGLNASLSKLAGDGGRTGDAEAMLYSSAAKGALTGALRVCRDSDVFVVDNEHLFLGALEVVSDDVAAELADLGVTHEAYSAALAELPS